MKKAYLSIGYASRALLQTEIETIRQILSDYQISLFVFVDEYHFTAQEEKQMMQHAFAEIDTADLVIAEVSEKAIGVGIEIGYAAANHKPVIYLRKFHTQHSTTAAGSADHIIIYQNTRDLTESLASVLTERFTQKL